MSQGRTRIGFVVLVALLAAVATVVPVQTNAYCIGEDGMNCLTCWTVDWQIFVGCACVPAWGKSGACKCCWGGGNCWLQGDGCYSIIIR